MCLTLNAASAHTAQHSTAQPKCVVRNSHCDSTAHRTTSGTAPQHHSAAEHAAASTALKAQWQPPVRRLAPRAAGAAPCFGEQRWPEGLSFVILGATANRTAVNGNAGSCIQGSAIGNATSGSSSACSWRIPGMFSFRSTRDDRETQFLLHSRHQWSTCGLGIALHVPD